MSGFRIEGFQVFLPALDYEVSLRFYQKLGFSLNWKNDQVAQMQMGPHKFLLQNFYQKDLCENLMVYLEVADCVEAFEYLQSLFQSEDFGEARVNPPSDEGHAKIVYLWDPSGVLLHLAETAS